MIDQSNALPDVSQIKGELRRILSDVTSVDVSAVEDDLPLLDYVTSSLALVAGMRQVYDRYGVLISIRRVLEGQANLGALAVYIAQALNAQKTKSATIAWERADRENDDRQKQDVPIAPSQRHVGFLARYSGGASVAYNEPIVLRLEGPLDAPALQAAIEVAGERHEVLRIALSARSDALELRAGVHVDLPVSPCPSEHVDRRLSELIGRPFEVGERMFRAELLRISDIEHVLVLVGHALLVDHKALEIVLHEIADVYRMVSAGDSSDAMSTAIQWTEYMLWRAAQGPTRFDDEAYWKNVYKDGIPRLDLPSDMPRPPVKTYEGARLIVPVAAPLLERIARWAGSEGLDPMTVWFGAFTSVLHRLAGQKDVVTGAGNVHAYGKSSQRVVARTHDMLPVRSNYDPDQSFVTHLHEMAALLSEVRDRGSQSFAELIHMLQLPRDQSRSALISAAFRSEDYGAAPSFGPLHASFAISPGTGARFDVELVLVSTETETHLCCDYSTDLFGADTVTCWIEGLFAFMQAGLETPSEACSLLPIMPERDRRVLLVDWNATEKAYPRERTALDLIDDQVRARGSEVAVRCGTDELTYAQLGKRIDEIAGLLHDRGVCPGDRVAVLLDRSPDLVAALLATWRVGASYVPLDVRFPKQRLAYMLMDAEVRTMITTRKAVSLTGDLSAASAVFLDERPDVALTSPGDLPAGGGADSAYIMYTSGSTGQPKGVEIKHSGLANFLLSTRDLIGFTATDSLLAITTVSFDISCLELLIPLIAGGVLEIGEDGLAADGIRLAECIERLKPSFVQATASTWKAVLATGWGGDRDLCIVSTGEPLGRELAEQLLVRGRALWNGYGPTETTIFSTAYRVCSAPGEPMRIGRPYPNTRIYILDAQLQPVPIGAIGDLYIGGDGLARGYWRRPELTNERFIPDPFRPGERIYRTGDLARYLPNGDLVCLGRLDDQVKVHGVRVELGEVEMALRGVPGVRDAVVTSWKDTGGDTQLVGHVISHDNGRLKAPEIRSKLRETLPEPMVPPFIVFADSFPLTANGKIHRAALPPPNIGACIPLGEKTAPVTPTEKLLAEAWSRVLKIGAGAIGRDDDFMELGGHSLLMTQSMIEVRRLFHVSFNMREFFEASTVRTLAALIDELQRARTAGGNGAHRSVPARDAEWGKQRMAFLTREAELPQNIAPARGAVFQPPREYRTALLTGATGFLGVYIVSEILRSTDADLYCLVRPRQGADGKSRIKEQMLAYDVWRDDDAWDRRLHIVEGDVILPRLGLPDAAYESLAREVDCVIHSAAHLNFIYPYEALRATNVLGVHEIIRFAFHGRIKPVHHLSTAAVWPMGSEYTFYEKDPLDHGKLLDLGYDEAKWVGERCLVNAAERGLPVARYRPGQVGGDSETGRLVLSHFLVAAFKGFLQFGAFPAVNTFLDVTPVDYVAKALVHMAFRGNPLGRAFHLTNPRRWHLTDALRYLRGLGYQFEEFPFEELRDRLVQDSAFGSNELFPYQAALKDMDERSFQVPKYDCQQTLRELEGSGIVCAPVDEQLVGTYMRYLKGIGFLPEPRELALAVDTVASGS